MDSSYIYYIIVISMVATLSSLFVLTGIYVVFMFSLVIAGILSFLILSDGSPSIYYIATVIIVIALVISSIFICSSFIQFEVTSYSVEYQAYSATAPFGMIYTDISGNLDGRLFFMFGYLNGEISSNINEAYAVKYIVDDELHSVTINAIDYPLKVDGKFIVEEVNVIELTHFNFIFNKSITEKHIKTYHVLHIPSLPYVNQTLNTDYIYIK